MNRITLDASHIILGQLNTVAIAWNFSKEMFYLYFKRFLVTCAHSRCSKSLRWQCPWAIWSPWFWLVTRACKIGPSCSLGIARLIKLVNVRQCRWWSRKKVAERNQNKGSKNGCSLFIVLQTELASFPTSRNQRVILDF